LFIYPFVLEFLFEGLINDFDQQFGWDHYDAVVITNDDVIWLHGGATAGDGAVHFPWHVAAPQDCGVVAVGIDRNIDVEYGRRVTNTAVGDDRGCPAHLGAHGQHISEGTGAFFTACFHHDDVVWLHGIHGLFLFIETATVFLEERSEERRVGIDRRYSMNAHAFSAKSHQTE